MKRLLFALGVGSLLLLDACVDEGPPRLTRADRNEIDTLYLEEIKTLRPILDSLCEVTFDAEVRVLVDSLLIEREREVEQLRSRQRSINR